MITKPESEEEDAGKQSSVATVDVMTNSTTSRTYSRSLSHISESSADGIVLMDRSAGEVMSLASGLSVNDIEMEIPGRTPEPPSSSATDTDVSTRTLGVVEENASVEDVTDQHQNGMKQDTSTSVLESSYPSTEVLNTLNTLSENEDATYVARRVSVEEDIPGAGADCLSKEGDDLVDCGLEDALGAVVSSLDDYRGQFPELQLLEQELKLLQVTLKVRTVHG